MWGERRTTQSNIGTVTEHRNKISVLPTNCLAGVDFGVLAVAAAPFVLPLKETCATRRLGASRSCAPEP